MTDSAAVTLGVDLVAKRTAGAGSVDVQQALLCTVPALAVTVLVNVLLAECTECTSHHCTLFLARTLYSPWGKQWLPRFT